MRKILTSPRVVFAAACALTGLGVVMLESLVAELRDEHEQLEEALAGLGDETRQAIAEREMARRAAAEECDQLMEAVFADIDDQTAGEADG